MKFVPALILFSAASLTLAAQNTGGIQGKITDTKGMPLAGVQITVSRIDITWSKTLTTDASGKYFQVGLEPKEFDITYSLKGYVDLKIREKIRIANIEKKDIVMKTLDEARKDGSAPAGASADATAAEAFNQAVPLFNEKRYTEALPLFQKAYEGYTEVLGKATDQVAKTETEARLAQVERVYGFTLMEVGMADPTQKEALFPKAEPMLKKSLERNAKDQSALTYLVESARFKQDAKAEATYQAALDALIGPRPELAYNQGVEAYNANKMKDAKRYFLKAIEIDPKFGEAYYLLAMCEFSEMNLKATKQSLLKYLEVSPDGKNAGTAKDMLADPSLKNVK